LRAFLDRGSRNAAITWPEAVDYLGDIDRLLRERSQHTDTIVHACTQERLSGKLQHNFAVCAVGGYGRQELFPHSDVDLILLFECEDGIPAAKTAIAEWTSALWDCGLRASHSVRTLSECAEVNTQNVELSISLLDARFMTGDRGLFDGLEDRLGSLWERTGTALSHHLAELTRSRHGKFNNTVFHLEPNIKDAPGGIRDIHVLRWLSRLSPQYATAESITGLQEQIRFLFRIRWCLHARAGRDQNVLNYEMQDEAARRLTEYPIAPEEWMRAYFRAARGVYGQTALALDGIETAGCTLLQQFRDWRSRLSTSDYTVARERVFLRNPSLTLSSAEGIFGVFTFVARHGLPLSWDTRRRFEKQVDAVSAAFANAPVRWPLWRELLGLRHAALALEQMQSTGVLVAALPEWKSIDSLVVRDFYHRYTVDEHTLVALQNADALLANAPETPQRFRDFLVDPGDQAIFRLALLLHDIGKGTKPGNHVQGSLETARTVLDRLQAPEEVKRPVALLIERHVDLSLIMTGRDVEDPATARFLTSRVPTLEDLRRLTLLTYCDISAVNATSMTPWRLEQLWRVYAAGSEQLVRELETDRIRESSSDLPDWAGAEIRAFLNGLPKRYLRTHDREQIEHHFALHDKIRSERVSVEITREAGAYLLTLVAPDQPGLFAHVCGALAGFGMDIVKAEAASNSGGEVLDQFRFADPMRTLDLNPGELHRLEWAIACVVRGSVAVTDLLKRRRAPRVRTETAVAASVRCNNDASDASTLIEFVGQDRPGLLYDLASTISRCGCNIELVMIDTEAHKAIDVFYVTRQGGKLSASWQQRVEGELLGAAEASSDS
jgi:[protein-PII] uridylyltransferase